MKLIILITALTVFSTELALAGGDDPIPAVMPSLVADKSVTGTGKRSDPFEFSTETKCILRLVGTASDVRWTMDDAPPDIEVIGNALVFSLASPGEYVVFGSWTDGAVVAWLRIKGPNGPPTPEDDITRRVKVAMAGQSADAKNFAVACDELRRALETGTLKRLSEIEPAMKAGLDAVGWPKGKYGDMTKLAGELFFVPAGPDGPIDAATKATFVANLKAVAKACEGVK